jgi:hypothetical protein
MSEEQQHYRHRWDNEVAGQYARGWEAEKTGSEFAKLVIQSGLLLNGGTLAAIPVLLDKGQLTASEMAGVAALLVVGLLLSAIVGAIAYFNFQFIAAARRAESSESAAEIAALATGGMEVRERARWKKRAARFRRLALISAWLGVAIEAVSYGCFAVAIFALISAVHPPLH